MSNVLITGGGRGLGLALARQFAQLPEERIAKVFVTIRSEPSQDLSDFISKSNGRVVHVNCDATQDASVQQGVAEVESKLAGKGLDILINNIGVSHKSPDGTTSGMPIDDLTQAFSTNVITAHRVTSAFLPLVRKSTEKKIVMISTTVGAFSRVVQHNIPCPAYKITKAALNMLSLQYALELGPEGITVLAVSPGWLKTDLGSQYADLEVETGANATIDLILKADSTKNGKLWNIHVSGWENVSGPNRYDGKEVAW